MSEVQNKKHIAVQFRKRGYLYSQIATELGISKSTASVWTKSVPLTLHQSRILEERQLTNQRNKIRNLAFINKRKRKERERLLNLQATQIVEQVELSRTNKQLVCALLYWCEGGKDMGSGLKFINSDPVMIRLFLKFLRESFTIDESKLRVMLHLHLYHNTERQLKYWSDITSIPTDQFYKPYMKLNTGTNKRENYPGCVSVRYLDVSVGKLLKMIYTEFGKII